MAASNYGFLTDKESKPSNSSRQQISAYNITESDKSSNETNKILRQKSLETSVKNLYIRQDSGPTSDCENNAQKRAKLKFKEKVSIKPPTELGTTDEWKATIVKDEEIIRSLKTKESIIEYTEKLMNQLEEIEKNRAKGYDKMALKEQYAEIQYKFELLEQVKAKLGNNDSHKEKLQQRNKIAEINTPPPLQNNISKNNSEKDVIINKSPRVVRRNSIASDTSVYDYFNDLYKNCDVVIVVHCCVWSLPIRYYLQTIKEKFFTSKPNINIACIYCSDVNKYEISDFATKSEISAVEFKKIESTDIRNNIINLKWNKSSMRIVCNLATSRCYHKKVDEIVKEDEIQQLLNYNRIMNYIFYINDFSIPKINHDQRTIKYFFDFFDEFYFISMIHIKTKYDMMRHLYNLKRMNASSKKEILKEIKSSHSVRNILFKDSSMVTVLSCERRIRIDDYEELKFTDFSSKSEGRLTISSVSKEVTEFYKVHTATLTYNLNSIKTTDYLWIEAFINEEIYLRVMGIHLIVRYLSDKFNEINKKNYIKTSRPYLLKSSDGCFFGQRINLSSQQEKLVFKMDHAILQAFLHFTYEFSQRSLIVIDLRPFEIDKNTILLTEPIIFSTNENKFGPSNLGTKAIDDLMAKHKCNEFCDGFSTKPFNWQSTSTSYCSLM